MLARLAIRHAAHNVVRVQRSLISEIRRKGQCASSCYHLGLSRAYTASARLLDEQARDSLPDVVHKFKQTCKSWSRRPSTFRAYSET